jgi:hypothetical protein
MRRDGRWIWWCIAIGAVALLGINSLGPGNDWVGVAEDAVSALAVVACGSDCGAEGTGAAGRGCISGSA